MSAQRQSTRPLTPCLAHPTKKKNKYRQVTWSDGAFQSFCAPNAGSFLRGDISWHRYFTCGLAVPLTPSCGGGPAPAAQFQTYLKELSTKTLRSRPRATRLRRSASIMPARPLIPLDIIGRLCLLPANQERRAKLTIRKLF